MTYCQLEIREQISEMFESQSTTIIIQANEFEQVALKMAAICVRLNMIAVTAWVLWHIPRCQSYPPTCHVYTAVYFRENHAGRKTTIYVHVINRADMTPLQYQI